jgi:hypothetical protein
MAFSINDADNYGGNGAGYFSLKDDGDSATVRFMYNQFDDIQGYAVHKVEVAPNRFRYVNCLREEYTQPIDDCPLCVARNFQQAKFYFNLFNCETEEVQLWERGKQILKKLVPVLQSIKGPICGTPIVITRHGVTGDQNTTYTFELLDSDGTTMEDLPETVDPTENIILSYSKSELESYVANGVLPGMEAVNHNNNSNNYNSNNATTDNSIKRRYTGNPEDSRNARGINPDSRF